MRLLPFLRQTGILTLSCKGVNVHQGVRLREALSGLINVRNADHCVVGNRVMIGAQAGLPTKKKIEDGLIVFGSPARPIQQQKKEFAARGRAAETRQDVLELKEKVKELEALLASKS